MNWLNEVNENVEAKEWFLAHVWPAPLEGNDPYRFEEFSSLSDDGE